MVGRPCKQRTDEQKLNSKTKTNYFEKRTTYRLYFRQATSKPTLIAYPMFFIFFPTYIWFCPDTQSQCFAKPKEPIFPRLILLH